MTVVKDVVTEEVVESCVLRMCLRFLGDKRNSCLPRKG